MYKRQRESGSIEQDADIVMFLDRSADEAEASRDDRPDEGVTRIVVAKNRSGPIGEDVYKRQTIDHSNFVGRIGIGRVYSGTIHQGDQILVVKNGGSSATATVKQLFTCLLYTSSFATRAASSTSSSSSTMARTSPRPLRSPSTSRANRTRARL